MAKAFFSSIIALSLILSIKTAIAQDNFPNGYKNMKFGNGPGNNFKEVDRVIDSTSPQSQKNPLVVYVNENGLDTDLSGIPVKNVRYWFCRNKLYRITMDFSETTLHAITQKLSDRKLTKGFERIDKDDYRDNMSERWDSKNSFIWIRFDNKTKEISGDLNSRKSYDTPCGP